MIPSIRAVGSIDDAVELNRLKNLLKFPGIVSPYALVEIESLNRDVNKAPLQHAYRLLLRYRAIAQVDRI
jgi:hypothetical protein